MQRRMTSNLLFGLAISCAALLGSFASPASLSWLAIFSVAMAMILTNVMIVRASGLAGIGGLSLVYARLDESQSIGAVLVIFSSILLILAVMLAILADLSEPSKGKVTSYEE
jgi:hypothetical protein